ncbi:TrbG/VirB9 family P-type conjugative transfer protein [Massilia sp. erpn]|uniref:TrbG/VirB9 family P-type conjugative transfer protein n=1 Tax=Massilia sp. erpn TaxID=2738142 RepID=UPI0021029303|nr:TrbG/VirB9 family P-type conjugative transfer protein [Massilia sp. erpn]UTY59668.1 TrbG/VirB9 family P-type conjugative transfer protein [Massilia sp. erpn]
MMRRLAVMLLWSVAGACAAADTMFEPDDEARRVELVSYSPDKVVKVGAIIDQPFLIEFAGGELLEEVAGGAVGGWEVHKKGNRLFVLARKDSKYTTLLVTTNKRSYVFDLMPKQSTPQNFKRRRSKIVFTYPVATPLPAPVPAPGPRNHNYSMQTVALQADIRPSEVYDDGRFTWLRFPGNVEVPAIYKSEPGMREEMLVNHHMEGEYVVMHAIAPLWNLRLAGSMIGVFNDSYERRGSANQDGTTVPGLVRESKP